MSNIHFYKKGVKPPTKDERVGFTFPSNTAEHTEEKVVGIKITGIDFVYILKDEKK
jgi:hypothetical protein